MNLSDRDRSTCTSEVGLIAAPPISPRSLKAIMTDKIGKKAPVASLSAAARRRIKRQSDVHCWEGAVM
jgi:hypothetical protein